MAAALLVSGCRLPAPEALPALPLEDGAPPTAAAAFPGSPAVNPAPLPVPASAVSVDDAARYLAGLPGSGRSPLASLRARPEWRRHAAKMDSLWRRFHSSRQPSVAAFSRAALPRLRSWPVVWYPFSGPDILFAESFFPGAAAYELCGLETCEMPPDLAALSPAGHDSMLAALNQSLQTAVPYTFFVTADMRSDLARTPFPGTLPVVLVSLARLGCHVDSVQPVALDAAGRLTAGTGSGPCPGYVVRYRAPGGQAKTATYFRLNLANSALSRDRRYLAHIGSLGSPVTFLKSASYLMHSGEFSVIRTAILDRSAAILQDDSGIPYRYLRGPGRQVTLHGRYTGVLDIFRRYYQFDLLQAYFDAGEAVRPLDFGMGYKHEAGNSALILSTRTGL